MKRIISVFLVVMMVVSMSIPVFATEPENESTLPSWVEDGETWFPVGDIMVCEDYGNCPKGHVPPSGYTYQGYTMGPAIADFDALVSILTIVSAVK